MDINKVILIARLTRDVEIKQTPSGTSVANFSVASGRKFKSGDDMKEETSFFDCVAWGKTGEIIAQYVKKGDRIGLEGRLLQRRWETEGKKGQKVEIVIENFQFLNDKKSNQSQSDDNSSNIGDSNPFSEESIPF